MSAETHCEMCGDSGVVQVERIEYITRDMAIDAGDRSLEGQPVPWGTEEIPCPACTTRESSKDVPMLDLMEALKSSLAKEKKGAAT